MIKNSKYHRNHILYSNEYTRRILKYGMYAIKAETLDIEDANELE